jgi:glyoxylase-like metal-dependent hydrolase (beta-lactamase superfamily II)
MNPDTVSVRCLTLGPLATNCWILKCPVTGLALIVDPGGSTEALPAILNQMKVVGVEMVVNTHGHFDHVWGNAEIRAETAIHSLDAPMLPLAREMAASWGFSVSPPPAPGRLLSDGDVVIAGKIAFKVLHSPGHSPGSICLLGHGLLVSGDTLFQGSIGRTDLPGGDSRTMMKTLKNVLLPLDDSLRVLPGHGPETCMRIEKLENPWL